MITVPKGSHNHQETNWIAVDPTRRVTALNRLWSDHNPILFHCYKSDFGPTPFKIYHSWFIRPDFDDLIKLELANLDQNSDGSKKKELATHLTEIEGKIENGTASLDERDCRVKILLEVANLESLEAMDTVQKVRIKWDIEGDERTKFFHSLVK
ncbi:Endonuclease/exonuclease/phosphatase [Artemisia annua]|uniref:Endonuclease/exonuclease/phosphatase n=1 Tax=Artemisia annua TaxID=35608 RepID=A0A2U1QDI4_ARTAN|nr:Endonuclease/exonuclease/phosphatase [Artemisia annua]